MKNSRRFYSLILAVIMAISCISALASCNSETATEETVTETASPKETINETNKSTEAITEEISTESLSRDIHPDISQKNLNEEFLLHILPDVNPVDCYWVEESKNDLLTEAIFDRQQRIYNYLGVEIVGTRTGNYSQYIEPFKTAVKNKDGSVDMLLSHVHTGVGGLVSENYLTDYNNVPGVKIEESYWNQEFMDNISINGHKFLGFNDFNILYTYIVSYNKDMMDKYSSALDESLYSMVDNYRWTLDKMISIANLAYIDTTNDGKTADDQFGITGYHWVPFCGFLHASNINLVEMDDSGAYVVTVYNDVNKAKTSQLIDTIIELTASPTSWFWLNDDWAKIPLTSGKTLMNLYQTTGLSGYMDYDISFGVLPYPMFDEAQADVGYRHLQWGGYLCVPSYCENIEMIGETIEMLAFFSDVTREVYFEKLLGKQVAESTDDKRMLDIVWETICSDFGQTYYDEVSRTQLLYMVPVITRSNSTTKLSSFMATVDKMANKEYKKFVNNCQ